MSNLDLIKETQRQEKEQEAKLQQTFTKRFNMVRGEHEESIRDLAYALRISNVSAARYANGQQIPRVAELAKIAQHYGVSMGWLMGYTDNKKDLQAYSEHIREETERMMASKMFKRNLINTAPWSVVDVQPFGHFIEAGENLSLAANDYQQQAGRTNDHKQADRLLGLMRQATGIDIGDLICGCMGLSGEVGEFTDLVKKWIFHEAEIDRAHLKKELGDVLWYVCMICDAMWWDLEDVMQKNIEKLEARYPDGFDPEHANHRKEGDV